MIAGPVASSAEKNTSSFFKGGQLIHYDYLGGTVQLKTCFIKMEASNQNYGS